MKIFNPNGSLLLRYPEDSHQRDTNCSLPGPVCAHKRGQSRIQLYRSGFRSEATEISEPYALDVHPETLRVANRPLDHTR